MRVRGLPRITTTVSSSPFRRLRDTGHVQGTGLGLTICMRVAKNHGGTLAIDPTEPRGATFVFTLPDRRRPPMP